ncbi:MAG: hypothetical protein WCW84_13080 [Sulfurimonas sp.]|jgi:Tfp pilus assembly protein FimT
MKRFAFTLLELVFVIIVIGILAITAMPNFASHALTDASEQVARHIRYAQHLSMMDDVYNPADANWYKKRWMINICQPAYTITRIDGSATATDPLTRKVMDGTGDLSLAGKYNVNSVVVADGKCKIAFDNLGRPYSFISAYTPTSPMDGLMDTNSSIALNHTDGNTTIVIRPQTGYVSVTYPTL